MRPNWRSNGVATAEAMVSGLAPGNAAPTAIVGKSICGNGATGKKRKATAPDRKIAMVMSVVATGRLMKGAEKLEEKFTVSPDQSPGCGAVSSSWLPRWIAKRRESQS